MNKFIEKLKTATSKMNKQLLSAVLIAFIIAGFLGFYAGRIYEQKTRRNRFPMMRRELQGQGLDQWQDKGTMQFGGSRPSTRVQE
ncbi:MAG: hypothetical protein WC243_04580 [Patescibacteria group bacterium]|jgi:hypothetical protein